MGQQALMGLDDNWSPDDPSNKPVRQADVLNPGNMIAFSDSAAKFPGEKKLTIGFASIEGIGGIASAVRGDTWPCRSSMNSEGDFHVEHHSTVASVHRAYKVSSRIAGTTALRLGVQGQGMK